MIVDEEDSSKLHFVDETGPGLFLTLTDIVEEAMVAHKYTGLRVPDPGVRIPNSEFRTPNSEIRIPNSGIRITKSERRFPNSVTFAVKWSFSEL